METRIANSGATTKKPISHWYLEDDTNTISFLFCLIFEEDFFRPLGDLEGDDET